MLHQAPRSVCGGLTGAIIGAGIDMARQLKKIGDNLKVMGMNPHELSELYTEEDLEEKVE